MQIEIISVNRWKDIKKKIFGLFFCYFLFISESLMNAEK